MCVCVCVNMVTMDLSYKSFPITGKKSPKISELSDFNEIFNVYLLMNEFYNTSVINVENIF